MAKPRGRKLVERRVTRLVERFGKGATARTARPVGRSGFLFAFVMTVLAMLGAASPALAAPGDLDTSFGEDGSVTTRVPDADGDLISGAWANDLAVQPDGKVVVAGDAGSDFALARYDEDGSLDSTFGEGGKLTTALSPSLDAAAALAIQPDGKIVAAGFSYNDNDSDTDMALVRYNEDGTLDETFGGGDGTVTTAVGAFVDVITALAIQPGGRITAAGWTVDADWNAEGVGSDIALARYNEDGTPDETFGGGDGMVTTAIGSGYDRAYALEIQPDGGIVVAGNSQTASASNNNPINDFAVARYEADGTPDETFGGDGTVTTAVGDLDDSVGDLALQPDGKIVLAGTAEHDDGGLTYSDVALARYRPDGSLDPLFGNDGKAVRSVEQYNDGANAVALQDDGKIVAAGRFSQMFGLARFYGGDDVTPTGSVTGLSAAVDQDRNVSLSWTNPTDGDFTATRVFRSTSGFAQGPAGGEDQTEVYEGSATSSTDANLPEGYYYYTAFAADGNGNYSIAATLRTVVDLVSPETQSVLGPSSPTANNKPTFYFYATDNISRLPDLRFSYRVDDGSWSDYSGATTATLGGDAGLPDGPHTIQVRSKDEAGNEDKSPAETTFTVDTTGPVVTIGSGPSGTVSANLARFEFSANEPGSLFLCSLDNTGNYVCDSPQVFDYLEDGEHTLRVWAEDGLGNRGATVTRTWTVAPETTSRILEAGEILTSDTEDDGATADDPVETSITSPVGGATTVTETATISHTEPAKYSFLGQQANISTPPSTAENPLRFEFRLDSSLIPEGETESTVEVFRNGVVVPDCADETPTIAAPDPCVLGRQLVEDDLRFIILTSAASRWNFGVTEREAPRIKGVTPADRSNASARTSVTATFSEAMRASTVSASNFFLVKKGTTAPVKAKVSYSAATKKATLNPIRDLKPGVNYVATLKGGAGGFADLAGNALAGDKTWSFTVKRR